MKKTLAVLRNVNVNPSVPNATSVTVAAAPVVLSSFTASKTVLPSGDSATLTPVFANAASATVDGGVGRSLVDPDGILKAMEINDNSIGRSGRELLRKVQAAKFVAEHGGEVCPASWEPGSETLRPGLDLVGKI